MRQEEARERRILGMKNGKMYRSHKDGRIYCLACRKYAGTMHFTGVSATNKRVRCQRCGKTIRPLRDRLAKHNQF